MFTQLDEVIQKLKSSPLFYLFLSSRELFHTNFWFWLSTLNKKETLKLFIDEDCKSNSLSFKREHKQSFGKDKNNKSVVDLLISCEDAPFVVLENKVKDFPTISQLKRIKNSFNNKTFHYVLATLFYSPDINFEGWSIRTYKEISNSLVPENFTTSQYYKNLIQDYKEFIFNLSELADILPITHEYDFANSYNVEFFHKLNEIKLWEGFQKLRASHLLYHFNNRQGIQTDYSINNQKATMTFFIPLKENYEIGITLEDNQFRKYIGGKRAEDFAHNLLSNQIFFNNDFKARGKKAFCKYDNKGDKQYRYQYEKIENSIPFPTLFDKICLEIDEVLSEKSLIENNIPSN